MKTQNIIYYLIGFIVGVLIWLVIENIFRLLKLLKEAQKERRYGFNRDETIKHYKDKIVTSWLQVVALLLIGFFLSCSEEVINQITAQ